MGKIDYSIFIKELDKKLDKYFENQAEFVCCKKGCSHCCEKGDYPLSELELKFLMQGYVNIDFETKLLVQKNINNIEKGGACPFLINSECAIYNYRPIICRVHGLAYLIKNNIVKTPYCANLGLNYSKVYKDGEIYINPINENLDSINLLKEFNFGEIRNLYDWIKPN